MLTVLLIQSARELSAAILGQELATALQQLQKWIEMPDFEDDLDVKDSRDTNKMLTFGRKVRGALRDVWKDPPSDVFDIGYGDLFVYSFLTMNPSFTLI